MPEDIDLYCLNCDYNLRGLSGDPRRCPECGYDNPMGDVEVPEPLVQQELRRMQTAPTVCVAVVLYFGFLVLGYLTLLVGGGFGERDLLAMASCVVVALLLPVPVWIAAVEAFKSSCSAKPGWSRVLLRYHLCGLVVAFVGGLPVVFVGFLLIAERLRGIELAFKQHAELMAGGLSVAILLLILVVVLAFRWMSRQAKKELEPLQRDAAVQRARERLRWRLRYGGGRPFIPKRPS